jgi:multimeric flavodoxin WrbA
MIDLIEEVLSKKGIGYRCFNLNEFTINHCRCCYYMRDNVCSYSCRTNWTICSFSMR